MSNKANKDLALLDTNIILYYINNTPWTKKATEIIHEYNCFISIISLIEIAAGWSTHNKELYYPQVKSATTVIDITEKIALQSGTLRYISKQQGKKIPALDAIIAATAITTKLPLLTNNPSDFQNIRDLKILPLDRI